MNTAKCNHFGCALDCGLAPWNQQGGPMTRVQILKRYLTYERAVHWTRSRAHDPLWVYGQIDRRWLWWLDPVRWCPPVLSKES